MMTFFHLGPNYDIFVVSGLKQMKLNGCCGCGCP